MSGRRVPDACPVAAWCDETGEHVRHVAYLGSVVAEDFVGRPLTVQVVAESTTPAKPQAAIILIDSRSLQLGSELSWSQARQVGGLLLDGAKRYG